MKMNVPKHNEKTFFLPAASIATFIDNKSIKMMILALEISLQFDLLMVKVLELLYIYCQRRRCPLPKPP
jgi:hypothetical protein